MSVHAEPPPAIVSEPHGINYATSNQLGKGGFAICYKAERLDKDKPTGHLVALKIVKTKMEPVKLAQKFVTELQIHSKLSHPNIVAFHRAFSFGESTYVVLELCSSGSLADMLKKRKSLTMPEIRRLIIQVSGAVKYLHARNIVHRDLKTGNLFLDEHMNIKVGDFGLAALLGSGNDMEAIRRTTMCGTPNYLAPEILAKGKGHNDKVDLWAIGIIAYTLAVGRAPFHAASKDEIYKKLKAGNYSWPELSSINNDISADLRDLVSSLLVPEEMRPCPDQIVSHPFFKIAFVPRQMSRSQTQKPPTWPNAPVPTPEVLQRGFSDSWWHVCKETGVGEYMPGKYFQLNSGKRIRSVVREIEKEVAAGRQPTIPIAHDTVYTTFQYSGTWGSQSSLGLEEIPEEKETIVAVRQLKDISNNEVQLPSLPVSQESGAESDNRKLKDAEMMPPPSFARRPGTVRRTNAITTKPVETEMARFNTTTQPDNSQPASDVMSNLRPESVESAVATKRAADASLARRPRAIRKALPTRELDPEEAVISQTEPTQPRMVPPVRSIRSRAKLTPPEVIEIFDDEAQRQGNLVLPAPPVMKASLPKPRSNIVKTDEFPGTNPEVVLERLCRFRDNVVASIENKRTAPSRRALGQVAEPLPFVSRWVDYSKKHGVGYILEDGTVGYIANASTLKGTPVTHIVVRDGEKWLKRVQPKTLSNLDKVPFDILEDCGVKGIQRVSSPRTTRDRERVNMLKVLWVKFGRYMCPGLEVCEDYDAAADGSNDAISTRPFVRYYQRLGNVGMWALTDGCIQVHFPDHTKLVLSADGLHVSATLVPADGFTAIQQCNEVPIKILRGRETMNHSIHALLYGSQPGRGQKPFAELVKANMVEEKLNFLSSVLDQWIGGGGLGCGDERVQWKGPAVKEQARKMDWVTVGRLGGDIVSV